MNIYTLTNNHFSSCGDKYKKKSDNSESISSLIAYTLKQSQCIKIGTLIENLLRQYICCHEHIQNLKDKNIKGKKERDHLFMCRGKKVYAELKSNLSLDTEKRKATARKVKLISEEEACDGYLVGLRYYSGDVPSDVKSRFPGTRVISLSQYLNLLEIECPFGGVEMGYKIWLNQVARELIRLEE